MRELSYLPQCSPYLPKSLQNPCCGIQGGNTLSEIIILYLVRPTFSQKSSCNENIYKEFFFFFTRNCALQNTNKGPSSQGYGFSRGHVWMDVRVGL